MKNVLVTGGTGFIGSNLCLRLVERGCQVRILRRQDSDLRAIHGIDVDHRIGDIRDFESLRNAMKGCDTVFHTAAIVSFWRKKRTEQLEVNVTGTRNVVEACLAENIEKLVHTSSVAAIGYPTSGDIATEETPYNWGPEIGYKYSKHLAEKEIEAGVERGLQAVIVNPTVVIGERDIHFHGGQLIRDIKKGRVPLYIDGGMNIVYVGDVATGHITAAEKGRIGERYILGGENLTHKKIFERMARLVGGRAPLGRLPIPLLKAGAMILERMGNLFGKEPWLSSELVSGAGMYNWVSSGKAIRELDYATTSFEDTVLAAYRWYDVHGFI